MFTEDTSLQPNKDIHKNLNGLVLSGGQSSRMGKDKGGICYHDISQRIYLHEMLSTYCNEVFISCNTAQSKQINDLPIIEDVYQNIGPLGGILSAFQFNQNTAWLCVACDLPFINEETISYLISHRNPLKTATAFLNSEDNFPEPLVTIWEPKAFSFLLQYVKDGNYSPRKALTNFDTELLQVSNPIIFKNVNTKEEYNKAVSMLQQPKY